MKTLGKYHPETANIYDIIGDAYYDMEEYDEARVFYEKCVKIRLKILGKYHLDTADVEEKLSSFLKKY